MIRPQYFEILHRSAESLEGCRGLTRLFNRNRPVNLTVDDPRRDAPKLTSQSFERWAAIRGNDGCERAGCRKERRNEAANRDEGCKPGRIAIREVPHPIAAQGQAREIHAVGVDLELSAHLLERSQKARARKAAGGG